MPKNLTVQKVSDIFSRTPRTICDWIKEGLFPHAFKVKDGWFIPVADVKRLMKEQKR